MKILGMKMRKTSGVQSRIEYYYYLTKKHVVEQGDVLKTTQEAGGSMIESESLVVERWIQ